MDERTLAGFRDQAALQGHLLSGNPVCARRGVTSIGPEHICALQIRCDGIGKRCGLISADVFAISAARVGRVEGMNLPRILSFG